LKTGVEIVPKRLTGQDYLCGVLMAANRKILMAVSIILGLGCLSITAIYLISSWKLNTKPNTPTPLVLSTSGSSTNIFNQSQSAESGTVKRNIPFKSVVLLTALYYDNGSLKQGWTGSGTFVSKEGLILTNAHVVLPEEGYPVDVITIAPTISADQKPAPAYIGKVIQADTQLDLAILQVASDLNGNPVDRSTLNFPVITLGDSDKLSLGDKLSILGYPGIGGDTITLTSGEVAGFTAETGFGNRAFIKTSATIAGGNSGGLAANDEGELVGIPTQLGSGSDSRIVDCRLLADTNGDGIINENDTCIPTGGFINSLRPVNLAKPMIVAALRGELNVVIRPTTQPASSPQTGGSRYSDDFSNSDSGWTNITDEDGLVGYSNGSYVISVTSSNMILSGTSGHTIGDVTMGVTASIAQSTGQGDYGMICRQQSDGSYYAFEIREDGYASIWKNYYGSIVPLADWQYFPSLAGKQVVNFTVSCVGDQLGLTVDGLPLLSISDTDFKEGDTGLLGGTTLRTGFIVTFDNFWMQNP
jgi:S1-C subfamily serine protease